MISSIVFGALGLLFLAVAAGLVCLLAATVAMLVAYRRSGRVLWPRAAVVGGALLYSPLALVLRRLGRDARVLDHFLIEAANRVGAAAFSHAGPRRLLAVPQCLRAGDCRAALDPRLGYRCVRCGRCKLGELAERAEREGFHFCIAPGDGCVKRLARELGIDAAIGVACAAELSGAMLAGLRMGVASRGVPLASDGCFETSADFDRVTEAMAQCGASPSR